MVLTHQALSEEERKIRALLTELSDAAKQALQLAMDSFLNGDRESAQQIIDNDTQINRLYQEVEELCFLSIALRQPVANDLRGLLSNMHIAAELERIADYAADIARATLEMEFVLDRDLQIQFKNMTQLCLQMLGKIMNIYHTHDASEAKLLAAEDDKVDRAETEIHSTLAEQIKVQPARVESGIQAACIAHKLERSADRVTNIAERIVFAAKGDVVALD